MAETKKGAGAVLWGAVAVMLAVGLICWDVNCRYAPPEKTSWLSLQTDTRTWSGFGLGIGIWLGAVALCALILELVSTVSDLLKALAVMWRPVLLLGVAAYLLFASDQGHELGLSLMIDNDGWWRFVCLFLALVYWAANTWHTARLGVHRALERGAFGSPPSHPSLADADKARRYVDGHEPWLYWPPRILGVCAHLFAAFNLASAAWSLPLSAWGGFDATDGFRADWLRRLSWTPLLAVALATAMVWAHDAMRRTRGKRSGWSKMLARPVALAATGGEFLLFACLAVIAWRIHGFPPGFFPGTIAISASAVVFLGFISWLRNRMPVVTAAACAKRRADDDRRMQTEIAWFTVSLFLVAFAVASSVWIFGAVTVGRFLGSMVVAYFGFGAILAFVNALEFGIASATKKAAPAKAPAAKSRESAKTAEPHVVVGAYVAAFMVGLAVLNAWLHPFHRVRLCDGPGCAPRMEAGYSIAAGPDDRPSVRRAALAWYAQAKATYEKTHGKGPVPMLIVATAGGGIRAAYWTATILERLERDLQDDGGSVRPYLFAISGVSGGSVGATAFEAALTDRDENGCRPGEADDAKCPLATSFLTEDFLAPALASLIFVDAPSSFLPGSGQGDRGAAIEKSFEHASRGLLARPFLSFFRLKNGDEANDHERPWWRPILLLNATHEETGQRIIAGQVRIDRNVFLDSFDELHELKEDIRASTAAHNSARFTYVSPAGDLGNRRGSVIDGGYYENYGALTALELARSARHALRNEPGPGVKLVILMISSDPGLETRRLLRINESGRGGKCLPSVAERVKSNDPNVSGRYLSSDQTQVENAYLNEFIAPLEGIKNVREAHGNRVAAELAVEICAEYNRSRETQTVAATLDDAKDVTVDDALPAVAEPDKPYFAHLAMCRDHKDGIPAPIQPPLGWVLSKATQDAFEGLLINCGNSPQLRQLELALGRRPLQQVAGP